MEPLWLHVATITLKNLPARLHRKLKNRAKEHHRSLNKEIIATLSSATGEAHPVDVDALIREARAARSKFAREITAAEIDAWKRAGRR
jgi:plasmid stability protein